MEQESDLIYNIKPPKNSKKAIIFYVFVILLSIAIIVAIIMYAISVVLLKIFSKSDILMLPKGEKIYKFLVKLKIYA